MHPALVNQVVKACRKRSAEGDYPVTPSPGDETLEHAVIEMADALDRILAADERGQGQPFADALKIAHEIVAA